MYFLILFILILKTSLSIDSLTIATQIVVKYDRDGSDCNDDFDRKFGF